MSRAGKGIDNGSMENFFGTLKSEIYIGKEFANYKDLEMKIRSLYIIIITAGIKKN